MNENCGGRGKNSEILAVRRRREDGVGRRERVQGPSPIGSNRSSVNKSDLFGPTWPKAALA